MHRRAVGVLTTLLLTSLALLTAPAADGATGAAPSAGAQRREATVTIHGEGYGHGKGLSQYGAQGRAKAGQTTAQILGFYYPGTTLASAGGALRVLLTGDTTSDVVVSPTKGLTATGLGAHRTWTLPTRREGKAVTRWRITPSSTGASAISYRTRSWHVWHTVAGDAQFAAGGRPVSLVTPAGTRAYRGTLRSASATSSGRVRDTVNVLPLDAYLRGVVPREVPALWEPAAVRAQAVAARTYAAYEREHDGHGYYDLCDTSHCQVYGGYAAEDPHSDAAVAATAQQVLTSGGDLAFAQFSASDGGYTVDGGYPYLAAAPDPFDHYAAWSVTLTSAQVMRSWPDLGDLVSVSVDETDGNGAGDVPDGRVLSLTVTGTNGSVSGVPGSSFASYTGLRSTLFRVG
ncbi:MAG: SpoIID/LytB domain-containing protein [Nocardioides sp.]